VNERVPYVFESAVLKYPEEIKGLISIIVPIYNAELYLKETLDSVMAQTFENWEAILVDDGSMDKSSEICTGYAGKDSRIKYIRKNNEGTLLARKTGLESSRGEFIANLDSDDAYRPQFLEKMFTKIKEENYDFVRCNFEDLNGKEKFLWGRPLGARDCKLSKNKLENFHNFLKLEEPYLWNTLVKRIIYIKILFPQINTIREDRIQHFQIIYHSERSGFIPESLYLFRIASATSSTRTSIVSKELNIIYLLRSQIALYKIIEHFFDTDTAEIFLATGIFGNIFLLNEESIIRYEMEYAKKFIPGFFRGLKKTKRNLFYKLVFILAHKGFTLPLIICHKAKEKMWNLKAKLWG